VVVGGGFGSVESSVVAAVAAGVFHDAFESFGSVESVEALVVVEAQAFEAFEAVESRVEQGLLIPLQYTC